MKSVSINVSIRYGSSEIPLKLPENTVRLNFNEPDHTVSRNSLIHEFKQLIKDQPTSGKVAIAVADKTRLCGYTETLPLVVELLSERGFEPSQIKVYIAYGTHPNQNEEECLRSYGKIYHDITFVHHDCHDRKVFTNLGTTSQKTPVLVRKDFCDADLRLTIGAVSHHYFAGYGGGRKLIFPGLAEKNAIYSNHKLFVDKENGRLAAGCQPGELVNNPLAEDLYEIHTMLPPYLSIHGILNSKGEIAQYHFGSSYQQFLTVCEQLDGYYKGKTTDTFDLVVASTGGYPKDINFIQTHKSIHHAAKLVRDQGTLIIFSQCMDGIGSKTFLPYFEMGGYQKAFDHLACHYQGNGGTALAMMEKTNRITIKMVTDLEPAICSLIGVKKITSQEAQDVIHKCGSTVGLIHNASIMIV